MRFPQGQAGCGLHPGVCDGTPAVGTTRTNGILDGTQHSAAELKVYVGQSPSCFVGKPPKLAQSSSKVGFAGGGCCFPPSPVCYIPSPHVIFILVSKYFRLTILMASRALYQPTKGSKACWYLLYLPCSKYHAGPQPLHASLLEMQAGPQTRVRIHHG